MGDLVVDFATVAEVVLDFVGVCLPAVNALLVFFLDLVTKAVYSPRCELFSILFCWFKFVIIASLSSFLRFSFLLHFHFEVVLLQTDLGTKRLNVLVGLLEDLHESGVLLSVDQIDVGVDVVVLEESDPLPLFLVDRLLSFLVLLVEVRFGQVCVLFLLVGALLVEFKELLLVIEHFLEELIPSVSSAHLTTTNHLLLEVI